MHLPITHSKLLTNWNRHKEGLLRQYITHQHTFVPGLLPAQAMDLPGAEVLAILGQKLGKETLRQALEPANTVASPLSGTDHPNWIKATNMVGINVRTIGDFWQVVKYILTVPATQDSVHLLPIWEPGVVSSLYGMADWGINKEFFSEELAGLQPHLATVEKQLKVVVNLLHAQGRKVGMDVIPHTDRYSNMVLANPAYFEWLRRDDLEIIDHRADLHLEVQKTIYQWLITTAPASAGKGIPESATLFFDKKTPETDRLEWLFGSAEDRDRRNLRKASLVDHLFRAGYEPVPATMGPPYRGIEVDPGSEAKSVDGEGRIWRDYRISKPQRMSRVFGPLVRYKLYERIADNKNWAIDFSRPRVEVWDYVCRHYHEIQKQYNFDFMRGDMSHVQMRPEGVPLKVDAYYDLHKAVKSHICRETPYFGYFAESFLTAPNFIAYGDEIDHLEQADAEATLGDLQSMVVGSETFMQQFRWYADLAETRRVKPSFTIMTGDKDDPRFDEFYYQGNEARLFIALFLTDWPSYMGLGFETRDPHPEPAPNEHYTKLYVFKIDDGPKATKGPYVWGKNGKLFQHLSQIRLKAEEILPQLRDTSTFWLLPPNPTAGTKVIAWTQKEGPTYLFVVNLGLDVPAKNIKIPLRQQVSAKALPSLSFTVPPRKESPPAVLLTNGIHWQIDLLEPGECRIYEL